MKGNWLLIQGFFQTMPSIAGGGVETAPKARQNRVEMKSIQKSQHFWAKKNPASARCRACTTRVIA
jgi:hypothetical protein